jgi:hypothetical protein
VLITLWRYAWPSPWSALGLVLGAVLCLLGGRMQRVQGTLEISGGALGRWAGGGVGPFGVTAITLGHVVLGSSPQMLAALRSHEQVHVRQYERWGVLFVPAYLASSAWQLLRGRHVYRDNWFEREAFAQERL